MYRRRRVGGETISPDPVRTLATVMIVANALIAFLSLTNLTLVAAGAIAVSVPGTDDLVYAYDRTNSTLLVLTQFTVGNRGIYPVKGLDIDTRLASPWGSLLASYSAHGLRVRAGEERTFPVAVGLSASELLNGSWSRLLYEDGRFELHVRVRASYTMGLTRFASDEIETYEWKAPLGHLREVLGEDGLADAVSRALGWAAPFLRDQISAAVLDGALSDGEWHEQPVGSWATLGYRMWLDDGAGQGAFDLALNGTIMGWPWSLKGSVPLVIEDGLVMLAPEVMSDAA
jgi:hypothetical protein